MLTLFICCDGRVIAWLFWIREVTFISTVWEPMLYCVLFHIDDFAKWSTV